MWISKAGPPEVLQVRHAPEPQPGPRQVRIAVEAIGVNFADIVGRLGLYADAPRLSYVLGYEVAGRIDAVGHIDRLFPLEEAAAAHRYIQERRNVGKVVLKP